MKQVAAAFALMITALSVHADDAFMKEAIEIAREAERHGNHPFGAVLVHDGKVILTAENTVLSESDVTRHAELNLVSLACKSIDKDLLRASTLYTSTEPCAMCSGAIYWAGIPKVVYGCSAKRMADFASGSFVVSSAELLAKGRRHVEVSGPVLEDEAAELHRAFWKRAAS